jgi:hypothetical protein
MNFVQDLAQYLERLLTRKMGPQRVGHRYEGIPGQKMAPYVLAPRRDKKPGSMLSKDLLEYKLFV